MIITKIAVIPSTCGCQTLIYDEMEGLSEGVVIIKCVLGNDHYYTAFVTIKYPAMSASSVNKSAFLLLA